MKAPDFADRFGGSVSCGTLRQEDLIPRFARVLRDVLEWRGVTDPTVALQQEFIRDNLLGDKPDSYYGGDQATDDLEWLFRTLDDLAPDGFTFGAHEDDGADFGFWPIDDDEGGEA